MCGKHRLPLVCFHVNNYLQKPYFNSVYRLFPGARDEAEDECRLHQRYHCIVMTTLTERIQASPQFRRAICIRHENTVDAVEQPRAMRIRKGFFASLQLKFAVILLVREESKSDFRLTNTCTGVRLPPVSFSRSVGNIFKWSPLKLLICRLLLTYFGRRLNLDLQRLTTLCDIPQALPVNQTKRTHLREM